MSKKKIVKDEIIEVIKGANIEGLDTVKAIKEFEKNIIEVSEVIEKSLNKDEYTTFAGIKYERKVQKGREGVTKLPGKEQKAWKTEDKEVVVLSKKVYVE